MIKKNDTRRLGSFGFQAFLWTQFLGALNDNLFKIMISMAAVNSAVESGGGSKFLSLVGAVFILPFLLFSGYAGNLADAFNKRTVLIVSKSAEIAAMGLAPFVLLSGKMEWMLAVLFLMAMHSSFFSPAKYGILPEMLPDRELSRANGLLEMTTFMAIILGTSVGALLFAAFKPHPEQMGLVLLFVAVFGTMMSFGIAKVPSPATRERIRVFPWSEIFDGVQRLLR
ncbi:MAG TPA: MFS transporter, partial [Nitrospiria bacterium]|nr:MFS transporter [Nitrospiria bacterium]